MLNPAARLRALAGALLCALILIAVIAHPARADDNPTLRAPVAAAHPPALRRAPPPRPVARMVRHGRGVEGAGRPAGHPLVAAALRDLGRGKFTGLPGPWCADATGTWLRRAGFSAPRSRRAVDFARYGRPTQPRPGAIVVSRHHVGVLIRPGVMVSGNWGGRVRIGVPRGVIAYRAPV